MRQYWSCCNTQCWTCYHDHGVDFCGTTCWGHQSYCLCWLVLVSLSCKVCLSLLRQFAIYLRWFFCVCANISVTKDKWFTFKMVDWSRPCAEWIVLYHMLHSLAILLDHRYSHSYLCAFCPLKCIKWISQVSNIERHILCVTKVLYVSRSFYTKLTGPSNHFVIHIAW